MDGRYAGAEAPALPRETKAPKRQLPTSAAQPGTKSARAMPNPPLAAQMSVQASSHSGMAAPGRPPLQPSAQPNVWPPAGTARSLPSTQPAVPQSKGKFPEQRSSDLFEWIGESDDKAQDDVLTFLNSLGCNLQAGPDEEVELDPEALSDEVLWKLDAWCQKRSCGTYDPDKLNVKQPVLSLAPADDEETDED